MDGVSSSMFDVFCPVCGGAIELSASDEGRCPGCATRYLVRIGHLIPVAPPSLDVSSPTGGAR